MKDESFSKKRRQFFSELRKKGYWAKQNTSCCRTCTWANIPEENHDKVVFYTVQNNLDDGVKYVWLSWVGDGAEICNIAHDCGLLHDWNGQPERSILIADDEVLKNV